MPEGFFRILKKVLSELICTRLYKNKRESEITVHERKENQTIKKSRKIRETKTILIKKCICQTHVQIVQRCVKGKLLWLPFSTSIIFIAIYGLAKKNIVSVVFSSSIQSSRFFASELTFQIFERKNTHPAISIICLVLLQVPKYFGCFKFFVPDQKLIYIFCASPKLFV